MRWIPAALAAAAALSFGEGAWADDLSYVSGEEIAEELAARSSDAERTVDRLVALKGDRELAVVRLERARMDSLETERRLAASAGLLYRLSNHGKAVKYLLSSESPMAFMKRIHNLRRFVLSGLEERRERGVRLAQAEADLEGIEIEIASAEEMLGRLEQAVDELEAEIRRRELAAVAAVRR